MPPFYRLHLVGFFTPSSIFPTGPQTLFGFQLAAHALREGAKAQTGLAAGIGPDFPPACMDWLRSIGVDTRGLVPHARPTPRAWQVFEEDGRRTQARVYGPSRNNQPDSISLTTRPHNPSHIKPTQHISHPTPPANKNPNTQLCSLHIAHNTRGGSALLIAS